jgi:hypothetical protein
MLYAFWDCEWQNHGKHFRRTKGKFICLTGNIQMAIIWMRLYEEIGHSRYLSAAFRMLDHMKALQDINTKKEGIVGGVKGSFPIYGSYAMLKYPNWAAKFFADALMLKIKLTNASQT